MFPGLVRCGGGGCKWGRAQGRGRLVHRLCQHSHTSKANRMTRCDSGFQWLQIQPAKHFSTHPANERASFPCAQARSLPVTGEGWSLQVTTVQQALGTRVLGRKGRIPKMRRTDSGRLPASRPKWGEAGAVHSGPWGLLPVPPALATGHQELLACCSSLEPRQSSGLPPAQELGEARRHLSCAVVSRSSLGLAGGAHSPLISGLPI